MLAMGTVAKGRQVFSIHCFGIRSNHFFQTATKLNDHSTVHVGLNCAKQLDTDLEIDNERG